jgi:Nif-specific regulatory protein
LEIVLRAVHSNLYYLKKNDISRSEIKKNMVANASIMRLKEISSWVSCVHDLDQLLELIIDTATDMMAAKASSLMLLDHKTKKLFFKVATGEKRQEIKTFEVKLGQGIAGYVAETGKSILIKDVKSEPRWYKNISDAIGFDTRSIACVPMISGNDVIGVVQIIDKIDGSAIEEKDLHTLEDFANLAALAIENARRIENVKNENKHLKEVLDDKYKIVGESKLLKKIITDAFKVANSKTSTLILGESGSGKELFARLIHRSGPRQDKTLIVINCAALPETLLEDELFGHEKGAFTGASNRKFGKFELADEGTIFLDEIGEMSPSMQAKLLRVLQEGVFYRVGGNTPIAVDVRVIAATNRNIATEVADGNFREDLYYRMNVVEIRIPPLRERKEDIPLLANHFLDLFRSEKGLRQLSMSSKAMEKLINYDWPGNVRELRNVLERAVVMGNGLEVLPEDLPITRLRRENAVLEIGLTLEEAINKFKREFILLNLQNTSGNRSKAAKIMGIQRTYLSRLISKYEIKDI